MHHGQIEQAHQYTTLSVSAKAAFSIRDYLMWLHFNQQPLAVDVGFVEAIIVLYKALRDLVVIVNYFPFWLK